MTVREPGAERRGRDARPGRSPGASAMHGRRGFSAIEVVVALLLLTALLRLSWGVAAAQRRALTALVHRGAVLSAERTVWWVLRSETAAGRPTTDWRVVEPGVLGLRAFRGRAVPCDGDAEPGEWVEVRYAGWRAPDPGKDSVLSLDGAGRWTPLDLVERAAGGEGCSTAWAGRAERWRVRPVPERPVLFRLFEHGSYHLEDAAFRYRRGGGGRQPLTGEVLDPVGTALAASGDGAEVRFRGVAGPAGIPTSARDTGWTRTLRGRR